MIALVVTDGDANAGVKDTSEIVSKFTKLNDGLVSIYMYGVKSAANRQLIDALTRANRGESFVFEGGRSKAGSGIDGLSERFRDPVLSDIRIVFSAASKAEVYPRRLKNMYRGETLEVVGRTPSSVSEVAFSLRGLNGSQAYEGFFKFPVTSMAAGAGIAEEWRNEQALGVILQ
jgi:Ca-activated chloride channel family protein